MISPMLWCQNIDTSQIAVVIKENIKTEKLEEKDSIIKEQFCCYDWSETSYRE